MRNNTIDPHRILSIVGAWPSIMGWMQLLNSDDVVAVRNCLRVKFGSGRGPGRNTQSLLLPPCFRSGSVPAALDTIAPVGRGTVPAVIADRLLLPPRFRSQSADCCPSRPLASSHLLLHWGSFHPHLFQIFKAVVVSYFAFPYNCYSVLQLQQIHCTCEADWALIR
jgi:hypothetical protein